MEKTKAATIEAIRKLQLHPNNPWHNELQILLEHANTDEDITIKVIELLSPIDNVRRWMHEQISLSLSDTIIRCFSPIAVGRALYIPLAGDLGNITASRKWICPKEGCKQNLPVIQEGEDPPRCRLHDIPMIRA